jgi:hypothetical protein
MKTSVLAAGQLCLAAQQAVPAKKCASPSRVRQYLTVTLLSLAVFTTSPAFAKDPCKTVLCMFGKLTGNSGGSECSSAEKEYFSIQIKKRGKIRWDRTSEARGQFLNSCPATDQGINKKINDKFGKVFG